MAAGFEMLAGSLGRPTPTAVRGATAPWSATTSDIRAAFGVLKSNKKM